jgi:hypothetical protein
LEKIIKVRERTPASAKNADSLQTQWERVQELLSGRSLAAEKTEVGQAIQLLTDIKRDIKNYRARLKALRTITRNWKGLSEEHKNALLKRLLAVVPQSMSMLRMDLVEVAPLIATPKYIQWRIDAIRELESHFAQTKELPYAELRLKTIQELSALTQDLARDLKGLKFPKSASPQERQEVREAVQPLLVGVEEKAKALSEQAEQFERELETEWAQSTAPNWERIQFSKSVPPTLIQTLHDLIDDGNLLGTLAVIKEAQAREVLSETVAHQLIALTLQKLGLKSEARLTWKDIS